MADLADLEQLAVRLEQSGDYPISRRVPMPPAMPTMTLQPPYALFVIAAQRR